MDFSMDVFKEAVRQAELAVGYAEDAAHDVESIRAKCAARAVAALDEFVYPDKANAEFAAARDELMTAMDDAAMGGLDCIMSAAAAWRAGTGATIRNDAEWDELCAYRERAKKALLRAAELGG